MTNWNLIGDLPFVEKLFQFDKIDSTNTFAKNLTEFPSRGLFVIVADRQTEGRGQRGNTFFSDTIGGIWATLVVPLPNIDDHFIINRGLSLSIAETLRRVSDKKNVSIKWPNDIYFNDKKVCGMLLEIPAHSNRHLIAGFGLNVNIEKKTFPSEINDIATSLLMEAGKESDIVGLLKAILERFSSNVIEPSQKVHERYLNILYKTGHSVEVNGVKGMFKTVQNDGRAVIDTEGDIGTRLIASGPMKFI